MAKKAAGKSKASKSKAKAKARSKPKSKAPMTRMAKKVVAKAKPAAKKLAAKSMKKMKAAVKSKAKAAGKKLAKAATKVAKAASKPGAARKAGETVRRKFIEVSQAVNDKTNSIAESVTGGVAMATGIVVGTVEAILPPRESAEFAHSTPPPHPEHAGEDLRDKGEQMAGEEMDDEDEMEDDDLAEIE